LMNRFDEVLVFAPLERVQLAAIATRMIDGLRLKLVSRKLELDVAAEAIEYLLDHGGYDPEFGARPMRRAIARYIEAPLAELLLAGAAVSGDVILCDVNADLLELDVVRAAAC
jgi:ATP-dependent Clp protease ATP-binding subunit ClpC